MLSLTVVFVVGGMFIGGDGLDLLSPSPHSPALEGLGIAALVLILFVDGLEVDRELVVEEWKAPLAKLLIAMPLTAGAIAALGVTLFDMSILQGLLLGSLLSPTDPILSSGVILNNKVPHRVRHSLSLESGLNDGLALPAILGLSAALLGTEFHLFTFLAQDLLLGLLVGVAGGWVAAKLIPCAATDPHLPPHQRSLYALGLGFALFGLASVVHGNGLIAVFVGAFVFGERRHDIAALVHDRSADVVEIVKLSVFAAFGTLLSVDLLTRHGWAGLAFVAGVLLLARPAAVGVALLGRRFSFAEVLFIGWFGPRGVASIAFAMLVVSMHVPGATLIFELVALVVFASIVCHGFTDTVGANWLARRTAHSNEEEDPVDPAPALRR